MRAPLLCVVMLLSIITKLTITTAFKAAITRFANRAYLGICVVSAQHSLKPIVTDALQMAARN